MSALDAYQQGDDISCTLTNSIRQPKIRVHKTVVSLVDANDRFTTQIRTGGMSEIGRAHV